eukprot:g5085.t1
MPSPRLRQTSDLHTAAFYGGAGVQQMLFDPPGAPMTEAQAHAAATKEIEDAFDEIAANRTLNAQIVYHYTSGPLGLWISGEWFDDAGNISLPAARIGPFLTAWGRYELFQQCKSFEGQIRRIHTDGILVDAGADTSALAVGTGLGQWALEDEGAYQITHLQSYGPAPALDESARKIQLWYFGEVKGVWEVVECDE